MLTPSDKLCSQYFLVLIELLPKRLCLCAVVPQSHFNSKRDSTQIHFLNSDSNKRMELVI